MRRELSMRRGAALVLFILLLLPSGGRAEESGDSPLQSRVGAAMQGFGQLKTREEKVDRQELLLAFTDSLEAVGDDVLASECLERAGIISYQFAEYENAQGIWARGLEVARRSGDKKRIAALLNAYAIGVSITGDNERAVELQKELILLRRDADDARGEGVSWYNLAYSYDALFRMPEAIQSFRRALRLQIEAGNRYGIALSRSALSNALFATGRIDEAMALADSAVVDADRLEATVLQGAALGGRGYKLHLLGEDAAALDDFERAHEILATGGVVRVTATTDVNRSRSLVALGRCEEALSLLAEVGPELEGDESRAERVAAHAVEGRALSACGRNDESREKLQQTIIELDEFRSELKTELGRAESFRLAGGAYTDLAAINVSEGEAETAWRLIEESTAAMLRSEISDDTGSVHLEEFRGWLGEIDAVAIQYSAATPDRVVACIITPQGVEAEILQLPGGLLREMATAIQLLSSGAPDDLCRPVLERLGTALLSPLSSRESGTDRLIVLPGDFAGIPFEALVIDGMELGDRFVVSYAPSATAFCRLQGREPAEGKMLILADPAALPVDASGPFVTLRALRQPLEPLPESRREAREVAVRGATILEGTEATREAVMSGDQNHSVIHFATHAVVDASHPSHSAIVLADSGDSTSLLTAAEIRTLELDADLVSLSGCSTADGYVVAGEGTLGLTRSFLVAGARTVVASWWDVEDAAARRFMGLFYENLKDGLDRDRALSDARAEMAREGYPARDRLAFALIGATATPVIALSDPGFGIPGFLYWILILSALIIAGSRWRRRNPRRSPGGRSR